MGLYAWGVLGSSQQQAMRKHHQAVAHLPSRGVSWVIAGSASPRDAPSRTQRGGARRWHVPPATIIGSNSTMGGPSDTPPGAIPKGRPCSLATACRDRGETATQASTT